MPVVNTAGRNAMIAALAALFNAGSGAGALVFRTAASAEVATLPFSDPAFGSPSTGVVTADAITPDASAAGGTTDRATLEDSDANAYVTASVGTSGEDINLSSVVIGAGDTVTMSSLTITQPAGTL
jgi:hypothetical protein